MSYRAKLKSKVQEHKFHLLTREAEIKLNKWCRERMRPQFRLLTQFDLQLLCARPAFCLVQSWSTPIIACKISTNLIEIPFSQTNLQCSLSKQGLQTDGAYTDSIQFLFSSHLDFPSCYCVTEFLFYLFLLYRFPKHT